MIAMRVLGKAIGMAALVWAFRLLALLRKSRILRMFACGFAQGVLVVVLVVMASGFLLASCSDQRPGWRNTKWGMTPEEVVSVLN